MGLSRVGPSALLGSSFCLFLSSPLPALAAGGPSLPEEAPVESFNAVAEARADAWGLRELGKEQLTDASIPFHNTFTATDIPETPAGTTPLISQATTVHAAIEAAEEESTVDGESVRGGSVNNSVSSSHPARFSRIALSPAALSLYLAVLIGLGVLAFRVKARRIPPAPKPPAVEAPSEEELIERLKGLKEMLPVADHFAKVAGTPETERQVAQARRDFQRAQTAQETDNTKVLGYLEKAEATISKVRQAALAKTESIVKDSDASKMDGLVLFLKQLESTLLTHSQAKTLSPFTFVLKSLLSQFEEVAEAMEEVRSHIEEETRLEQGLDVSVLDALEEDMEFLRKLQQNRRNLLEHATEQQSGAAGALGLVLTQRFARDLRQLHGFIDLAEVYQDLASTVAAESAARGTVDDRLEKYLLALQGQLSQSKRELAQLLEETAMIPLQKSPALILARSQALGAAHKKLNNSVMAFWDRTVRHLKIPSELDFRSLERVKTMVKTSLQRVSQEGMTVLDLLKSALSDMEKVSGRKHADIQHVKVFENAAFERMAKGSVGVLLALQAHAEERVTSVSSLLDSLQPGVSVEAAGKIMEQAATIAAASSADLSEARVQSLRIHSLVALTLLERENA
ncbi:hypothetical protein Emag_007425 [Eimeria magna]